MHFKRHSATCSLRVAASISILVLLFGLEPASAFPFRRGLPDFSAELKRASSFAESSARDAEAIEKEANASIQQAREEAAAAAAAIADIDSKILAALSDGRTEDARSLAEARKLQELRLETAESEAKLLAKRRDLAEKHAEIWKRRLETLGMAGNIDLRAIVATPEEATQNLRRLDDLRKEMENQSARLRRSVSRRHMSLTRLQFQRGMARKGFSAPGDAGGKQAADIITRATRLQQEWAQTYRSEEKQAAMQIAFLRAEMLVRQVLADMIRRRKEAEERERLKAQTSETASRLEEIRSELSPRLAEIDSLLDEIKRSEEENIAHADMAGRARENAAAVWQKTRLEAEEDLIRECISLAKASAAFAEEQEERRRVVASLLHIEDMRSQRRILEESARTSEEYILSFNVLLARIDNSLNALGLERELLDKLGEEAARCTQTDFPSSNLLASLAELASRYVSDMPEVEENRPAAALFRLAQRAATRRRLEMAEEWLHMTRRDIEALDALASSALWTTRDVRFTTAVAHEIRDFVRAAWGDLTWSWDSLRLGLSDHGESSRRRILAAVFAVLILVAGIRCLAPLVDRKTGTRFDAVIAALHPAVPFVVAAFAAKLALPEQTAGWSTAAVLLAFAAWFSADAAVALLLGDPKKRTSASLVSAIRGLCRWNLVAAAFAACALAASTRWHNPWHIQPAISALLLLSAVISAARFLVHPALLGRLLGRCSENAGAKLAGAVIAAILVIMAASAAAPWIFGYTALALRAGLTAALTIVLITVALLAGRLTRLLLSRTRLTDAWAGTWTSLIRAAAAVGAAFVAFGAWGTFARDVFLAPNTPWTLALTAHAASDLYASWLRFWHAELAGGMTVGSLVYGIAVFIASFWISAALKRLFVERVLAKTPMDESTRATFASIAGYLIIVVGFITGLNVAGSSLSNLALLAGAVTVGVGFGLQNVINNFVSSLLIHFSRTIRVGDYIEAGGTRGTVQEIGLRNTVVRNDDGVTVLIPNGSFVTANIINWTSPQRRIRLHVPASVPRTADLAVVSRVLIETAQKHPRVASNPPPTVELRSVAGERVNIELLAWTDRPPAMAATLGELHLAVDRALQEFINPKP